MRSAPHFTLESLGNKFEKVLVKLTPFFFPRRLLSIRKQGDHTGNSLTGDRGLQERVQLIYWVLMMSLCPAAWAQKSPTLPKAKHTINTTRVLDPL